MSKPKAPPLSEHTIRAWALTSSYCWGRQCERCHRRRFFRTAYYEVYGRAGKHSCWWWECVSCLLDTISELATEALQQRVKGRA